MTALIPPRWLNGPSICAAANLPAFETEAALRKWTNSFGDGAIIIERIGQCRACGLYHAQWHGRELSGWTSGTGTRAETNRLPKHVQKHNAELSRRDTEHYQRARR